MGLTQAPGTVVLHVANGAQATGSRAGIATPEIQTVLVQGTVRVRGALRSTGGRSAHEVGQAVADRLLVVGATLGIGSARRGLAWVNYGRTLRHNCRQRGGGFRWSWRGFGYRVTSHKGISPHSLRTRAGGQVVVHVAEGVQSAGAWTGILALLPDAGLVPGAVRVEDTLRPAAHVGISSVLRNAAAFSTVAHRVGSTDRGVARILHRRRWLLLDYRLGLAGIEGIAGVTRLAEAVGLVLVDSAHGVVGTRSWAGIPALLVDAGQVRGAVRIDDTLWPAVGRRSSVVGQADAGGGSESVVALRVGTTGRGVARVELEGGSGHFILWTCWDVDHSRHRLWSLGIVVDDRSLRCRRYGLWLRGYVDNSRCRLRLRLCRWITHSLNRWILCGICWLGHRWNVNHSRSGLWSLGFIVDILNGLLRCWSCRLWLGRNIYDSRLWSWNRW